MFKILTLCTLIATISGVPSHNAAHQTADTVAAQSKNEPQAQGRPVDLLRASLHETENEEILNDALLKALEDDSADLDNKDPALRPLFLIVMRIMENRRRRMEMMNMGNGMGMGMGGVSVSVMGMVGGMGMGMGNGMGMTDMMMMMMMMPPNMMMMMMMPPDMMMMMMMPPAMMM